MLRALGFPASRSRPRTIYCCGTMTVEGAPHLKAEHLPVFDCANPCGRIGKRFLSDLLAHPDDGRGTAVHQRRHLQDHQHAGARDRARLPGRLCRGLAARPQGDGALPRRLEAVAAAGLNARRPSTIEEDEEEKPQAAEGRSRSPSAWSSAGSASGAGCLAGARATRRKRWSAATRSICAPASTRTARSARSSSTCTRKAPPSAR